MMGQMTPEQMAMIQELMARGGGGQGQSPMGSGFTGAPPEMGAAPVPQMGAGGPAGWAQSLAQLGGGTLPGPMGKPQMPLPPSAQPRGQYGYGRNIGMGPRRGF